MTTEEAIKTIETALAQVEWECPMDYAAAFDMAIAALRAQQERENQKPLTLEAVAQAYLEFCGDYCVGDDSVGIPCCQFYRWPDLDDDEHPCLGECMLNPYRHKPKEGWQ